MFLCRFFFNFFFIFVISDGSIVEFRIPTRNSYPNSIAADPVGGAWFTESNGNKIGRIAPDGSIVEFSTPTNGKPWGIAADPVGGAWFTESNGNKIGRIAPCSSAASSSISSSSSSSFSSSSNIVTIDPAVACCTQSGQCRQELGSLCPAGETKYNTMAQCMAGCGAGSSSSASVCSATTFSSYSAPSLSGVSDGAATGPDGNLWFITANGTTIGKMSPSGILVGSDIRLPEGWQANEIVLGSDGNLWLSANVGILRINPDDAATAVPELFTLPVATLDSSAVPNAIVLGPDGNVWFTTSSGTFGKITPQGNSTQYPAPGTPYDITVGSDGSLWYTSEGSDNNEVVNIAPDGGRIASYPMPQGVTPGRIIAGPDGNMWFLAFAVYEGVDHNRIVRIKTNGTMDNFPLQADEIPGFLAPGPDGNVWFTSNGGEDENGEWTSAVIASITPSGFITRYDRMPTGRFPRWIVPGPNGNLWAAEMDGVITEIAACRGSSASSQDGTVCEPICGDGKKVGPEQCDLGPQASETVQKRTAQVNFLPAFMLKNVSMACPTGDDCKILAQEQQSPTMLFIDCDDSSCSQKTITEIQAPDGMESAELSGAPGGEGGGIACPEEDACMFSFIALEGGIVPNLFVVRCRDSSCEQRTIEQIAVLDGSTVMEARHLIACPAENDNMCNIVFHGFDALSIPGSASFAKCMDPGCADRLISSMERGTEIAAFACPAPDDCKASLFIRPPEVTDPGQLETLLLDCDDAECSRSTKTSLLTGSDARALSCPTPQQCQLFYDDNMQMTLLQCRDGRCQNRSEVSLGQAVESPGEEGVGPMSVSCKPGSWCNMSYLFARAGPQGAADDEVRFIHCLSKDCSKRQPELIEKNADVIGMSMSCPSDDRCMVAYLAHLGGELRIADISWKVPGQLCESGACNAWTCRCEAGQTQSSSVSSSSSFSSSHSSSLSSSSNIVVLDPTVSCCSQSGQCRQQMGSLCPAGETKYNTMAQCQANCGTSSQSSSSTSSFSSSSIFSSNRPVSCPSDPCGEGGKELCGEQGRTCVRDTASPDCIRCKGGYQCTGDECGVIGKKYCESLGKSCIANKQSPLCISCIEPLACRGNECAQRGSKYCAESGKACIKTNDGICFECRPEPQPACTGEECKAGGAAYCALFGKSCAPIKSGMCIACADAGILTPPPFCPSDPCGEGGDELCGERGKCVRDTASLDCIRCEFSTEKQVQCNGNECRAGGAAYCGMLGKGCRNTGGDLCFSCIAEGCASSIECAEGAQCDGGRCVQLCGNGRLDMGEACDPSAGPGSGGGSCTSRCLLKQNQKCTHDAECGSRLCVRNACVPCSADYQCQSKDCRKGACVNLCGNGRIDPGEACDPGIGDDESRCTRNCLRSADAECARNRDCQTGLCRDVGGSKVCDECSGGDQCYNGLCVSGVCADLCGNGVVDPGEQCDDGNRVTGDGCSRFCERKSLAIGGVAPFRQLGEGAYSGDVRGMSGQYDEYGNFVPLVVGAYSGDVRGMSGQYDEYGNFIPLVAGAYRGDVRGSQYDEYGRPLVAGHAAAGKTGPAALMAIAGGAAAGWAWIRRKRRADR
ncbi:hypothetical protein HYW84_01700 [Candidatus Peregrinibacteria bacterium]|nr:hypothetical protein [Candidatus Peregrinibacteria bacterium]